MLNLYPYVDDVIKNNDCVALEGGSNNVFSVDVGAMRLVYKSLFSPRTSNIIKKVLKNLEEPVRNYYTRKIDAGYSVKAGYDELFDIEHRVLDEWKKRNIPCMRILEHQDKALVYKYLNAINFSKLLRNGGNHYYQYQQVLDIVDTIRNVAKKENDPMLLHSDLLPKNFLYVFETDSTIAIDPGMKLKNLPLAELDARINLMFIQDLNIYPNGDFYINTFLDTLNKEEQKFMRELNHPIRCDALLYLNIRAKTFSAITGKPHVDWLERYSSKNIANINKLLDKHIG